MENIHIPTARLKRFSGGGLTEVGEEEKTVGKARGRTTTIEKRIENGIFYVMSKNLSCIVLFVFFLVFFQQHLNYPVRERNILCLSTAGE